MLVFAQVSSIESRAKLLHGDVGRRVEKALDQRARRLDAGGAAISAERTRASVARRRSSARQRLTLAALTP